MLVEHHAVEAELVGVDELIDIFLVESARLAVVPQPVGYRDPAGVLLLVKILVEIGISHEMPAEELHRFHHSPRKCCHDVGDGAEWLSDYNCKYRQRATAGRRCQRGAMLSMRRGRGEVIAGSRNGGA